MSNSDATAYLAGTALLAAAIGIFVMLRSTFKRKTQTSVIDHVRCLELSTQWNHALLVQVAELSKQNAAMREALNFYAEPENWKAPFSPERNLALKDRGAIARSVFCDGRIAPTSPC